MGSFYSFIIIGLLLLNKTIQTLFVLEMQQILTEIKLGKIKKNNLFYFK